MTFCKVSNKTIQLSKVLDCKQKNEDFMKNYKTELLIKLFFYLTFLNHSLREVKTKCLKYIKC